MSERRIFMLTPCFRSSHLRKSLTRSLSEWEVCGFCGTLYRRHMSRLIDLGRKSKACKAAQLQRRHHSAGAFPSVIPSVCQLHAPTLAHPTLCVMPGLPWG